MREMFEAESVRITVLVGAYATIDASFDTRGLTVFVIASASMKRSGIRRVMKRSLFGTAERPRTVSTLLSFASRIGITLIAPPGVLTVVKPLTCRTDSKTA